MLSGKKADPVENSLQGKRKTQDKAGDAVGVLQKTLSTDSSFTGNGDISNLSKTDQNAANHETDFDPPIYNVWKQQSKTAGASHFGNSATCGA